MKTGYVKNGLSFRVMIWQPFAFYILLFSVYSSKSPFQPPIRKLLILKLTSSFFFFMKNRTTLQIFFETAKKKARKMIIACVLCYGVFKNTQQ